MTDEETRRDLSEEVENSIQPWRRPRRGECVVHVGRVLAEKRLRHREREREREREGEGEGEGERKKEGI